MDRRSFLAASATLLGPIGSTRAERPQESAVLATTQARIAAIRELRQTAPARDLRPGNSSFTKGLPHSARYEVGAETLRAFRSALAAGDPLAIDRALGESRVLVNPMAAHALQPLGPNVIQYRLPEPPEFEDKAFARDVLEVLWAALCRDVPFGRYASDPLIAEAKAELGRLGVSREELFGPAVIRPGPAVSQFLLRDIDLGGALQPARRRLMRSGLDYATDFGSFLRLQNGLPSRRATEYLQHPLYLHSGRSLASLVYQDYPGQLFIQAAQQLFSQGRIALNPSNPYAKLGSQVGFATWGAPHCFALLGQVSCQALTVAWFHKWLVHCYPRPEEYLGRVHLAKTRQLDFPVPEAVGESVALQKIAQRTGSYLLPLAYPEGAPAHPSYPAGHAVYSGACATILKIFFDPDRPIAAPVVPNEDGTALQPYAGQLSVGDEIDKLAWNVSFGRAFAGVHWRFDCEAGIALGEAIARDALEESLSYCAEPRRPLRYRTFFGNEVTI
jgi:membrane-associated phospholipid phosphatase